MANSTLMMSRDASRRTGSPLLSGSYRGGSANAEAQRKALRSGKKAPKRGASPPVILPGKIAPKDGRVYLNKCNLKTLDALGPHQPRLEFLYVRDNFLRSFQGLGYMPVLKILDVSSNCLESLEFLGVLPNLRELYLNANMLTTLDDLPTLPHLEVLSVCQNEIESLRFMQPQPELRAFFVSHNHIKSLDGFPAFPNIESLRTTGNPLELSEQFALTAIIACGDTLRKLNGQEISPEDQEIAGSFSAVASIAIRYGWMVGDGDAHQYLFEMQQEECMESPLELLKAEILGYVQEGCELVAQMSFKWQGRDIEDVGEGPDEASGLYFDYQWLRGNRSGHFQEIPNACMKHYVCSAEDVGYSLKVECTPVINLEEDDFGETVFAVTDTVAPAEAAAVECTIVGVLREGETVRAHTVYSGGKEGESLFSWFRCPPNASPELIVGAESREYVLVADDVDCTLRVEYTPVREDGEQGEPILGASGVIQAAAPSVSNVHIVGELLETSTLTGYGDYFGGIEAASRFQWYRSEKNSTQTFLAIEGANAQTFVPTAREVGRRIKFEYTPVDEHGEAGLPSSCITVDVIAPCPPSINNLRIEGDFEESYPLTVAGDYFGGLEGKSQIQWWRRHVADNEDDWEFLPDIRGKKFVPTLEDIDFLFRVEYVPVRSDGKLGTAKRCKTSVPIQATEPRVKDMVIYGDHGEYMEGVMLEASVVYIGGIEGDSKFAWYRSKDANFEHYEVIEGTNGCMTYIPTFADVGRVLKFKYYPVREDGVHGVEEAVYTPEIHQGLPMYHHARIEGKFYEKSTLVAEGRYFGGREGATEFKWWRVKHNGKKQCVATNTRTYTLTANDVGCEIMLMVRPVREDGVKGEWVITPKTDNVVLPALPTIEDLGIIGDLREGSVLNVVGQYYGGEEGESIIKWFRINPEMGEGFVFRAIEEGATYTVQPEDLNMCLKVEYTPVRYDGVAGETVSTTTSVIKPAMPTGTIAWDTETPASSSSAIVGDPVAPKEAATLHVSVDYKGGKQGAEQKYAWYHVDESGAKLAQVATTRSYTPTVDDIGHWLLFEWTPVRDDGEEGDPHHLMCGAPVAMGDPVVSDVKILRDSEDPLSRRKGQGTYAGGVEGASRFQWFRVGEDGKSVAIDGATFPEYQPTEDDLGFSLKFSYTPVRSDNVAGVPAESEATTPLVTGPPRVLSLTIKGEPKEGERLALLAQFTNTSSQLSKYQWYANDKPIKKLGNKSHLTPTADEVGTQLKCTMIPVDSRGVEGEPFTSDATPPIKIGEPKVVKLEIYSQKPESCFNNVFQVKGKYIGGQKGKCLVKWFRKDANAGKVTDVDEWTQIPGVDITSYVGTADDYAHWLKCEFTPVRNDGVAGEPQTAYYYGNEKGKQRKVAVLEMDKDTRARVDTVVSKAEELPVQHNDQPHGITFGPKELKFTSKGKTVDKCVYSAEYPKVVLASLNPKDPEGSRRQFSLHVSDKKSYNCLAETSEARDIVALAALTKRVQASG